LYELVDESIRSICMRSEFNSTGIMNLWQNYLHHKQSVTWNQIWTIVSLERWLKKNNI